MLIAEKLSIEIFLVRRLISVLFFLGTLLQSNISNAQGTIDVGKTGWDVKRPVMASACESGCPWGELGDFIQESMKSYGYSVILCRNCNRWYGPRLVSENDYPPPLDEINLEDGVNVRVDARVDFGVTSSAMLSSAYNSTLAGKGPYRNLRLIAKLEDPFYYLIAVKMESGIKDFSRIIKERLPVKIMGADANTAIVLQYYGITPDSIKAWGGKMGVSVEEALKGDFDIIGGFLASPSMNPESSYWTALSQKFDLYFLELPEDLLKIIAKQNVDAEFVEANHGLLRGVDRKIKTLGRSGEAIFARDDTPDQAAYELAKAIDENHGNLKWFIRVYTYDPKTVWQNFGVPLHPGAEKYYKEIGYLKN
ncbi:MAG TPA: TAXI family TRAP transporter solute-binding subunit [Ignavibacteriaceae bacterium]|nr:TAXI family TRAP transporter solute-binding subunit [Ignavibacteriaceae bacterium]